MVVNDVVEAQEINSAQRLRIPSYTTTARDAISNPQAGEIILNTTTEELNLYDGTAWVAYNHV